MAEAAIVDPAYRPLGFESDLNNPNFGGAMNPDSRLWVQFYDKPRVDNFSTQKEGHPIFKDRVYVRIQVPGNQLSIIDTYATDAHKARFPREWQAYLNRKGTDQQIIGTPLNHWPLLTPAQAEELRAIKFMTVEHIAGASDAQLQAIGMIAGMNAFALRDHAKAYLQTAKDAAAAKRINDEAEALKVQLETERKAREELEERHKQEMAEMHQLIAQATQAPTTARRGRPPKVQKQE